MPEPEDTETGPEPHQTPRPDAPDGGGWRLRDLSRAGRVVAVLTVALLMVPVASSLLRARDVGWVPSGDDALIVLRSFDVPSADAPLVGQPSTAETYSPGVAARHPGPAEMYLLAVPIRVLGAVWGTLLTAALIAAASVLIAAWAVFRRAGPSVALGAAVVLGLVMWSSGTAVLSDPISSNVGGYPLLAGAALAWAIWCGDRRLWPLAAAVWSFTIQQHLAIFGVAGLVALWGVTGAVLRAWRHRADPDDRSASLRWGVTAAAVAVVCWIPPLVDQVAGTGNLGKILGFSRADDRDHLGLAAGLRAAARVVAVPPIIGFRSMVDQAPSAAHPRAGGLHLIASLDAGAAVNVAIGLVLIAGSGVIAWRSWRRGGDGGPRLLLVATAGVLLLGGVVTTTQIPDSAEAARINFYRWVWPAAAAAWGAVLWTTCRWARAALSLPALSGDTDGEGTDVEGTDIDDADDGTPDRLPGRGVPLAPLAVGAALLTLAGIVTATALHHDEGDARRDEALFAFDARASEAVAAAVPPDRPVRIDTRGYAASLSVAPALGAALVDEGFDVRVATEGGAFWDHRARPPEPNETVVCVLSNPLAIMDGPGTTVASESLPTEPGGVQEIWGDAELAVRVLPPGETRCTQG